MWLNSLWHRWFGRSRPLPSSRNLRRFVQQRPRLEALEERALLSGNLPYADPINAAQLAADIRYADSNPGSYTIALPSNTNYILNNTTGALPALVSGVQLTINGNGDTIERDTTTSAFRLFDVKTGASLTLKDLTLKNGLAQGSGTSAEGGAVYSSGNLTLDKVMVANNQVQGNAGGAGQDGSDAAGGGVYVAKGRAAFTNDTFRSNLAEGGQGGNGASSVHGGTGGYNGSNAAGLSAPGSGAYVTGGALTLSTNSLAVQNSTGGANHKLPSDGGAGGTGFGGGLYVADGTVILTRNTFSENSAKGGNGGIGGVHTLNATGGVGGVGGNGSGGGLYAAGGTVTLRNDTLLTNAAQGGGGGGGTSSGKGGEGSGGGMTVSGGEVQLTDDVLGSNSAVGGVSINGGGGGDGRGGGLSLTGGTVVLNADTLKTNRVQGGSGAQDGFPGGPGGNGGNAYGGGLYVASSSVALNNNTLEGNIAQGGAGGAGNPNPTGLHATGGAGGVGGTGKGGGLYVTTGPISLHNDTLSGNKALGGSGGRGGTSGLNGSTGSRGANGMGIGGGLKIDSGGNVALANTLIANNFANSGNDVYGTVASSDHDLIGDGTDSNLHQGDNGGDLVGYPANQLYLGPLANNHGVLAGAPGSQQVVQTMALLSGSPAINAGDNNAAPAAVDARGYARIVGSAIDIGAYEFGANPATTNLSLAGTAASGTAPGGQIVYHLTVRNNSATAQRNVTLADVLPANTTLVAWTPAVGWNSSAPAVGSNGTATAWIASLPGHAGASFTLIVQVNSGTPTGTALANTASVGPIAGDPKPGNNSITFHSTVTTGVNVSPDVKVSSGKIFYNRTSGLFTRKVALTNLSANSLSGPLALELTNLASGITLFNSNGFNSADDPYVDFLVPGHSLAPGKSITITLEFKAATAKSITYGTEVLQGI